VDGLHLVPGSPPARLIRASTGGRRTSSASLLVPHRHATFRHRPAGTFSAGRRTRARAQLKQPRSLRHPHLHWLRRRSTRSSRASGRGCRPRGARLRRPSCGAARRCAAEGSPAAKSRDLCGGGGGVARWGAAGFFEGGKLWRDLKVKGCSVFVELL
jgi:hypothetical protein